jgi:hypothetical protein
MSGAIAGEEALLRKSGLHDAPGDRISLLAAAAAAGRTEVLGALEDAGRALGITLTGRIRRPWDPAGLAVSALRRDGP